MRNRKNWYRLVGSVALAWMLAGCDPSQLIAQPSGTPQQPQTTQTQVPAPSQPLTATQQRVRVLIEQVEAAYSSGEQNYKKGNLPEAKMDFDRAVDLILSSGLDIKSNEQLQDEFDKIVDGVNALEMEALKQGNGFVPKDEPTPAEVASDVTFEVDPNVVAKARAELATTKSDLPLMVNDYVAAYINFFANTQKGHNTLLHSFQRAGRYRAMIQRIMAEEGVPQDLIYLAVAESGFNPRAIGPTTRSGGKAGGMWQFMPQGNYGLVRNAYVDERFDPEKSTRAYARYIKFIYDQLGDWYLSMAGYNWGAGNVQRAVQKTGYADFWELYKRNNLPGETKNYVPEILAAIIIANHPTQYGFDDVTLDPPILTDTVTINSSVDLRLVSDIVDAPIDELMALNPSLLRMVTPPGASFDLHLPAGTATLFQQRIALIPEGKRNAWRYHRVVPDDTLESVARTNHVSVAELAEANQLGEAKSISGMHGLVVPLAPIAAPSTRMLMYTARKGDTLVTIADRFGVSLTQLRRWNKIEGVKVEAGRRLHVAEPATAPGSTARTAHHRAASGVGADGAKAAGSSAKPHETASQKKSSQAPASHRSAKQSSSSSAKNTHAVKPATKTKSAQKQQK
jgi:membrane-bound lytic murein transglycosylase D